MSTQPDTNNSSFSAAAAFEHIQQFSGLLASTTELPKLYNYSLSLLKDIFDLDYSTLLLFDEKMEHLIVRDTIGFPESMINTFMIREGQGVSSLALKSGKVETVDDYRNEDRFKVTEILKNRNILSAIAAPMKISQKIFGIIIGHCLQERIFSEEEKQFFQVLANLAAIAINNGSHIESLYNSEQNRERQIQQLQIQRKETEKRTNEFESIFSNIVTGILLLKDGRYIARCNEKFAEMFGYESVYEIAGMSARELHTSDENFNAFGRENYSNLVAGKTIQSEYQLRKKDGTPLLCRLSGRAVDQSDPPDLTKGFVWLIEDISRRKRMEEEILQARKLESIGILAGGIGHDFNNILSVIIGNLGLAQRLLKPEDSTHDLLNSALEASMKAKDLTGKLLLFTRRDSHSIGTVNLKENFNEYNYHRFLRKEINLETSFPKDLYNIKILPDHLSAILTNLLVNAENCMEDGGKIVVTGNNRNIEKNDFPGVTPGNYVEIKVIDNGCGMDGDILENIFDPYFTTKTRDSKKGMGLGLAIVHSIVKRNGGNISVESSKKEGTTFNILLPATTNDVLSFEG